MKKREQTFLESLNDPSRPWRWLFFFLVSGSVLAVLPQIALQALGTAYFIGTILVLSFAGGLILFAMDRSQRRDIDVRVGPVAPRLGLIVLVSQGPVDELPARGAIDHHLPMLRYLWLVCSRKPLKEPWEAGTQAEPPTKPRPKSQSSYTNAHTLYDRYRGEIDRVDILQIDDQDNPSEVFAKVQHAYQEATRLGLRPEEIVADVTGGTKSMTIGLALAGIPASRDLQVMRPSEYDDYGFAVRDAPSHATLVDVNFVATSGMFSD